MQEFPMKTMSVSKTYGTVFRFCFDTVNHLHSSVHMHKNNTLTQLEKQSTCCKLVEYQYTGPDTW